MKEENYEDIIYRSYPYPSGHRKMERRDRAAQFAPFAALTGFEEAIEEASKILEEKKELDESQKEEINEKILCLKKQEKNCPIVRIVYFQKEKNQEKGQTLLYEGTLQKVEEHTLLFANKKRISFEDIYEIEAELDT